MFGLMPQGVGVAVVSFAKEEYEEGPDSVALVLHALFRS
jgi:hypothetical protein